MLLISKQRKNGKNKAKKSMPSDALPFTPRVLAQMELKQTKAQNS